ncbi:PE domain-containing protein [Gandjariella thermophila]|uniref:PE domain-containing protein n=1 Tax=Gandjariella thermophila TaxID=1931992 RepID=A0A4D4J9A7_9PSEU|nr:PE domain-containing protein [Gandjariella thermophila]GDY30443.1 hypothetical protein GTS_20760 [Gandjariella thermophila]
MSAPADPGGTCSSTVNAGVSPIPPATAGAPTPRGNAEGATGGATVTVNRDNVLRIAKLFQDEADRMSGRVAARREELTSRPALGDPVSRAMADVLNWKLVESADSYANRAGQYVDELYRTAAHLTAAARSYGYTDEDIVQALRRPVPAAAAGGVRHG